MIALGPKTRGWLVLSRLSNLPTIWTNVLAGWVLAGAVVNATFAGAAVAVSLLYVGGMVLNDVCDAAHDRVHRSRRPIPAGLIPRSAATYAAVLLMLAGLLIVYAIAPASAAVVWALGLVAAIAYYDMWHKRDPAAPLVMGVCRGLVYAVAASIATGGVPSAVVLPAIVLTLYVAGFTVGARYIPAIRPWVSLCIAGISLVDAGALIWAGAPVVAAVAAAGMPLTLVWQRSVPGD